MYSFTVLESRSPKSRCPQGHVPLKLTIFLCLFQPLFASNNLHFLACNCSTSVSPSMVTLQHPLCVPLHIFVSLLIRTLIVLDQEPILLQYEFVLTYLIISVATLFPKRSRSKVLGMKALSSHFGECKSLPQQATCAFSLQIMNPSFLM